MPVLISMECDAGSVCLFVESELDIDAAWRIVDMVKRQPPGGRLLVDFSRAPLLHDYALAVLVQALQRVGEVPITARGLRDHSVHLLTYLGIDPCTLRPVGAPDSGAYLD